VLVVPQQQVFVMERFGKYAETLEAGLYFRLPVMFQIGYVHSLKERALHVESQQAITADNVSITIDGVVYLKITDPYKASYGVADPEYAMTQLAQTTMRSELGKMKLDNTLQERDTLNANIVASINKAADDWGIQCLRYEIKDITLSAAMKESMAQESMAERTRRAEITRSEGSRQAAINVAEGKKRAIVLESEASRIDQMNRAKGEADAIREVAEAGAKSIELLGHAIQTPGGQEAAALRVAEQYVASFANLAKKGNTLIMPAAANDAASMVGQAMSVYSAMQQSAAGRNFGPTGSSQREVQQLHEGEEAEEAETAVDVQQIDTADQGTVSSLSAAAAGAAAGSESASGSGAAAGSEDTTQAQAPGRAVAEWRRDGAPPPPPLQR
jgi:regulator of protease activity HflC (stomatin/prohibitin superfamily)